MPYQTRLPDVLASFGLTVETVPGWQTRGAAGMNPRGALCHWTAGPRGTKGRPSLNICINGRPGLPGPLCHVYLDRAGIAVVVAAGVSNHAGAGNWRGLTGNSQLFGTEAECGGDGDWTAEQRWAYPRVNAAFCKLGEFGPDMVGGHSEHAPTRKIDIRDWPMSAMRTQVAAVLAGGTDDGGFFMALSDAQQRELYDWMGNVWRRVRGPDSQPNDMLQRIDAALHGNMGNGPDGQVLNHFHWAEANMAGRHQAILEAVRQLGEMLPGQSVDLAAIEEAGRRGAARALQDLTITVATTPEATSDPAAAATGAAVT